MSLAPGSEYHSPTPSPTPSRPERRGVSRQTIIEAAKEIHTEDLAKRLCHAGLRRAGKELVGLCPLHDDRRTPNFYVNPEKDTWFCFVCLVGGDVVELARYAWGYEKYEVAMAAADLLHEFGHPIPERPASWHRKQERQKPVRSAIGRARFDHLRRRLFRCFFEPSLVGIDNQDERESEAALLWDATAPLAEMMLERLRGGSS
jgi:CHC2 zinc finger